MRKEKAPRNGRQGPNLPATESPDLEGLVQAKIADPSSDYIRFKTAINARDDERVTRVQKIIVHGQKYYVLTIKPLVVIDGQTPLMQIVLSHREYQIFLGNVRSSSNVAK